MDQTKSPISTSLACVLSITMFCVFVNINTQPCMADVPTADSSASPDQVKQKISPLDLYRELFKQKRLSHLEAVKALMQIGNYEKQYKMVTTIMEQMYKVLSKAQLSLQEAQFAPGDPFPKEEAVKEAYSHVAENTALFGDILLRLPDITHNILKRKRDWDTSLRWAVGFCNDSQVFVGNDATLLHLMSQELGIIPKEASFVNPYSTEEQVKEDIELSSKYEAVKKRGAGDKIRQSLMKVYNKRKEKELDDMDKMSSFEHGPEVTKYKIGNKIKELLKSCRVSNMAVDTGVNREGQNKEGCSGPKWVDKKKRHDDESEKLSSEHSETKHSEPYEATCDPKDSDECKKNRNNQGHEPLEHDIELPKDDKEHSEHDKEPFGQEKQLHNKEPSDHDKQFSKYDIKISDHDKEPLGPNKEPPEHNRKPSDNDKKPLEHNTEPSEHDKEPSKHDKEPTVHDNNHSKQTKDKLVNTGKGMKSADTASEPPQQGNVAYVAKESNLPSLTSPLQKKVDDIVGEILNSAKIKPKKKHSEPKNPKLGKSVKRTKTQETSSKSPMQSNVGNIDDSLLTNQMQKKVDEVVDEILNTAKDKAKKEEQAKKKKVPTATLR